MMDNKLKKLVFATNNKHKLEEARQIVAGKFDILSLSEIGCDDDIPETAPTLEGNAKIKARWIKERYGYDCFADDTGLMVDSLGGEPGVMSARYAGPGHDSSANMRKLLDALAEEDNRKAHFSTAVALILDGKEYMFEGRVDGTIARTPAGDNGFGYDPVFVADETGKRFAEMSSEEKNEISHRGRAMRKLASFLTSLVTIVLVLFGTVTGSAEQWRLHPTFANYLERIIDTPDYVYVLSNGQPYVPTSNNYGMHDYFLFRYDKSAEETEYLNILNKLSESKIVNVEYNYDKRYMMVSYESGAIDLIYDDGKVVTIQGLKVADATLGKKVNSVTFVPGSDQAWLATAFGYVSIDDKKGEIASSRNLDREMNAAVKFMDKIFLGNAEGLYVTDLRNTSTSKIGNISDVSKFFISGDRLYVQGVLDGLPCLAFIEGGDETLTLIPIVHTNMVDTAVSKTGLAVNTPNVVWLIDKTGADLKGIDKPTEYIWKKLTGYDGRNYWGDNGYEGVAGLIYSSSDGTWKNPGINVKPNAANCFKSTSMAYSDRYGMLVRNHGFDDNFTDIVRDEVDYISGLKGGEWKPYSTAVRMPGTTTYLLSLPAGLAIDPNDKDVVYCGSVLDGILRLNLADPSKSLRMGTSTDHAAGQPGYIAINEAPTKPGMGSFNPFMAPDFDNEGVMWLPFFDIDNSTMKFWYWSPEDRKATVSASTYRPMKSWDLKTGRGANVSKLLPLKTSVNKNIISFILSGAGNDLILINHNGTLDNRSDDKEYTFSSRIYDQDGGEYNTGKFRDMFEDPSTGNVWVGCDNGVFYFNPREVTSSVDTKVTRIKVPRNDGSNFADYLLDGVVVNKITEDRQGRKWFATKGGGVTCTSSSGTQVIKTYTTENSSLPNDIVYGICYNPENNSMMISTDAGLAELFLSGNAGGGDDSSDVKIYPNPVRPDYYGYVTIEGVEDGALVKITDHAGNLVKELGFAEGGTTQWDVTNLYMKRVPSGVYYVLASGGPNGSGGFSSAGKILVVN